MTQSSSAAEFLAAVSTRPAWWEWANCKGLDAELFFVERGASTLEAKEVCRACVVRQDCLDYAVANDDGFGIWGGCCQRQRRKLRAARRREAS